MGYERFQAQLQAFGVTLDTYMCRYIIEQYRAANGKVQMLWNDAERILHAISTGTSTTLGVGCKLHVEGKDGIRLPNGMALQYPGLHRTADGWQYSSRRGRSLVPTKLYGGKVVENVCQALARIIIGEQMLEIAERHPVVMTVHDAVAALVPDDEVAEGVVFVESCMRKSPPWAAGLPLNCESGHGPSYGDC
jgi:DNA polymerase